MVGCLIPLAFLSLPLLSSSKISFKHPPHLSSFLHQGSRLTKWGLELEPDPELWLAGMLLNVASQRTTSVMQFLTVSRLLCAYLANMGFVPFVAWWMDVCDVSVIPAFWSICILDAIVTNTCSRLKKLCFICRPGYFSATVIKDDILCASLMNWRITSWPI
jgi:hypothetical protein